MSRVILHVSDLHFGRHVPDMAEALLDAVHRIRPTVVVISGDLTQRARESQFAAARAWIGELPVPHLAVPGNHDIPLYDIVRRIVAPLERYRRYLGGETDSVFTAHGLTVLGLNSARPWRVAEGAIDDPQIERICRTFEGRPEGELRVLVTHHPLIGGPPTAGASAARNAPAALEALQDVGADLLLSGHTHHASLGVVTEHDARIERSMLALSAGTTISTRTRNEPNAFNLIHHEGGRLEIEVHAWSEGYRPVERFLARRTEAGWERIAAV